MSLSNHVERSKGFQLGFTGDEAKKVSGSVCMEFPLKSTCRSLLISPVPVSYPLSPGGRGPRKGEWLPLRLRAVSLYAAAGSGPYVRPAHRELGTGRLLWENVQEDPESVAASSDMLGTAQAQGVGRGREPAPDGPDVSSWKGGRGKKSFAPPKAGQRPGGRLPAEMAVEGDLMVGPTALGGAFALHAQIDPRAQCEAPAQPHAVPARPRQRQAAVGRQ